jgi:hypothetical protein
MTCAGDHGEHRGGNSESLSAIGEHIQVPQQSDIGEPAADHQGRDQDDTYHEQDEHCEPAGKFQSSALTTISTATTSASTVLAAVSTMTI